MTQISKATAETFPSTRAAISISGRRSSPPKPSMLKVSNHVQLQRVEAFPTVSNKNDSCFGSIEKQIIYLHAAIVRLTLTPRWGHFEHP